MSDYRRLISYIYEYEGKEKGKNVGFVKLEARNGQCRMNINVKRVYVGGNAIGVYLLGKQGQKTFLGNIFVRGGNGEFRAVVDAEDVEGSGNGLDTYYGLTVHDVKNSWRSYTTIWEDAVSAQYAPIGSTEAEPPSPEIAAPEASEEEAPVRNSQGTDVETGPVAHEVLPGIAGDMPIPAVGGIAQEIEAALAREEAWRKARENTKPCECTGTREPETHAAEVGTEAVCGAAAESGAEPGWESAAEGRPEAGRAAVAESRPEAGRAAVAEGRPAGKTTGDALVQSPELENPDVLKYLQDTEGTATDPEQLWQELRKAYPKIQPFDYAEGSEVLTVRPQDIGRLPRENWVYGNNSFLLHGYYNFRYLILVRLENANGNPRYLLGVPGHYYSNEKYMATMFGFPNFVLSKKQPPHDGRFGYWYTDIKMR